jgi:pimeloyl-ACP methyl ester carboxylesterase
VLSKRFVERHPGEVARIVAHVRSEPGSRASLVALLGAAARHDAKPALDRIRARSLVLAGTRDALAAEESQRWLAVRIGARFESIDAGHDLTLEAPRETADAVLRFLASPQ